MFTFLIGVVVGIGLMLVPKVYAWVKAKVQKVDPNV